MDFSTEPLPRHVEESVKAIALLHAEHHRNATAAERLVDKATAMVSRPAFIALAAGVVAFWCALNLMLPLWGRHPFDAAPFPWLMDGVAIVALLIASLIVTTQRRANKLADLREQMTLELGLLTEQKTAKIIALLEELRADSPQVPNRADPEARELAKRTDPEAMRGAIEAPS